MAPPVHAVITEADLRSGRLPKTHYFVDEQVRQATKMGFADMLKAHNPADAR